MRIRALSRDSSARGSRDKSFLQHVRLVDFLDSVGFLADRRRQALDSDWPAIELVDYRAENRSIHLVESRGVDFEQVERG